MRQKADKLGEDLRATVDHKVKALAMAIDKHLSLSSLASKPIEGAASAPRQ
jgi:hypothetical protein